MGGARSFENWAAELSRPVPPLLLLLPVLAPMKTTVLTIEDDPAIRRGIRDVLAFAGYQTLEAADAASGLQAALTRTYDLLLLDIVLPGGSGLDILQRVRQAKPQQAVIILSARGEEIDRVAGLRGGADDYVVKPFGVDELLARAEAVLRRSSSRPVDVEQLDLPQGRVHFQRREIQFTDGQRAELTDKELLVLRYLVQHAERAISREELLVNVWGIDARGTSTRTVDMTVVRLREKLRDPPESPQSLLTVRGKGYMWARTPEAPSP